MTNVNIPSRIKQIRMTAGRNTVAGDDHCGHVPKSTAVLIAVNYSLFEDPMMELPVCSTLPGNNPGENSGWLCLRRTNEPASAPEHQYSERQS
jgi:hypothetical protein